MSPVAEDDRRHDREAEAAAGRVQEAQLGVDLDVAEALVGERPLASSVLAVPPSSLGVLRPATTPIGTMMPSSAPRCGRLRKPTAACSDGRTRVSTENVFVCVGAPNMPGAGEPQRPARVRGDEPEREVPLAQHRRRVHGDEALRVHRGAENLQIDGRVLKLGVRLGH